MKIEIHRINNTLISEVISDKEENIHPDFFVLITKLAGDILQKIENYHFQLAIVGDFEKYSSESLKDFIYESNKHRKIIFVRSVEEAKLKLV